MVTTSSLHHCLLLKQCYNMIMLSVQTVNRMFHKYKSCTCHSYLYIGIGQSTLLEIKQKWTLRLYFPTLLSYFQLIQYYMSVIAYSVLHVSNVM